MLDGTYKMTFNTAFGSQDATIVLRTEADTVIADIDAPLIGKREAKGRAAGDTFTAEGSGSIMFVGKVDYTLKGEVSGDVLRVEIESTQGNFTLEGVRA